MDPQKPIWIVRDYSLCTGCRRCEIACSLFHEGNIWPEASRIRIFMFVPGTEFPHFCAQCDDYPCVASCPTKALSVNEHTGAVLVDRKKCTACASCVEACPGRVPHIHPTEKYAIICDLCGGEPQCARVCNEGKCSALRVVKKAEEQSRAFVHKLYARKPKDIARDLAVNLYGEFAEGLI